MASPISKPVELPARLDGQGRGDWVVEHVPELAACVDEVRDVRAVGEEPDIDALGEQLARPIQAGCSLCLCRTQPLVQSAQLATTFKQLLAPPQVVSPLSAEEVRQRVADSLGHPLAVLTVEEDVGVGDLALPLEAVEERMHEHSREGMSRLPDRS